MLERSVPFRARRSMAAAEFGSKLYLFGGVGAATGTESILDVANDLWCFDTKDESWRRILTTGQWPEARRCAGWTRHDNALWLWGGSGVHKWPEERTYTFLNDAWRFCPTTERWELLHATDDHRETPREGVTSSSYPAPRYTPVFQSIGGTLFLFGGYTEDRQGKRKLNDAWIGNGKEWRRIPTNAREGYAIGPQWPGPRYGSMSATDGAYVYVFGGVSDEGDHSDLWRFDVAACRWELLVPEPAKAPQPRYCGAFCAHGSRLYLFGGRSRLRPKANFNDLWMFDPAAHTWLQIQENREPHRYDEAAEFPGYHAKAAAAMIGDYWYVWGGEGRRGHVSDFWRYSFCERRWTMIAPARGDDPVLW